MTKAINSYVEVREVLKLIDINDRKKIPNDLLMSIEKKAGNEIYSLKFDYYGNIILSHDAENMLLYLYYDYILKDNEQLRNAINLKMKENQIIRNTIIQIKNSSLKVNELFENKDSREEKYSINNSISTDIMVVGPKKKNLIVRIINTIINYFKRIL